MSKFVSYWKLLKLKNLFKPGITLGITLSYDCNLNCPYCTNKNGGNVFPKSNEQYLTFWKDFISTFPIKVNEVIITGGEPLRIGYSIELIKWLLNKGYFVSLYSNLITNPYELECIFSDLKNKRFKVISTYHHQSNINVFMKSVEAIERIGIEIEIHEIDYQEIYGSKVKPLEIIEKEVSKNILRISPDGMIFTNCFDRNKYGLCNTQQNY